MRQFLFLCLAASSLLVLPSFAFTTSASSSNYGVPTKRRSMVGASLKIQRITKTITTTVGDDGQVIRIRVTELSCSGPAFDCAVNSSGDPGTGPPLVER